MNARPDFAPWDVRTAPRILPTDESVRRVRTFAAAEALLAKALDAFSGVIDVPHAQATLSRHARRAEWHSFLFHHALTDADAATPTDTPIADEAVRSFVDAVLAPSDAAHAIEFLTGVYRVLLPRQITAYTYYVRAIGVDAADSDERWFDFVMQDAYDGIRDGELLLQSLLAGPDEVQRSATRRAELENMIVPIGGLVGPDTLGALTATNKGTGR